MSSHSPPPTKVPIYSASDLKTTTDDALSSYLTTLPQPYTFTPSHAHSTIRLTLGYTAVLLAATLFFVDNRLGWAATKPYTLPACALYFLLNGLLTAYTYFVERGCVFAGVRQDAGGQIEIIKVRSRGKRYSPVYELGITYHGAPEQTVRGEFMQWFSKEGYLQRKEFARWLSGHVEVLGRAERERRTLEGKGTEEEEDNVMDGCDVVHVADREEEDVIEIETQTPKSATPGTGRKGKGRKKAGP